MGSQYRFSRSKTFVSVKPKCSPVLINKSNSSPLKLLILNCQSVLAKKPSFLNLINENDPDLIAGTESWLSETVHNNEIFPSTYFVYRRDRADGYGGVFLACKSNFISEEIALSTSCEIVTCRMPNQ